MSRLEKQVADALLAEAPELAERWRRQAPTVAPRADEPPALDPERAVRLVAALGGALRNDAGCYDAVMRAGWELGTAAHDSGSSLHYLLKELGLLEALVLYACERVLRERAPGEGAADGLALARRLHRFFGLLTQAAAKGFTSTYVEGLQDRFRTLRHDLRNPLGTIKSAMSLMSDESVPPEMRDNPRIRQIMARNATSLDTVIGQRLSDASTQEPAFSRQEVSLRGVALAVRRELREEMADAGCQLVVSDGLPTVHVDSMGLELALKSVIATLTQLAAPHTDVVVELADHAERRAALLVRFTPSDAALEASAVERALAFAGDVLTAAGGRLAIEDHAVRLELPLLAEATPKPAEARAEAARPESRPEPRPESRPEPRPEPRAPSGRAPEASAPEP